LNVKKIIIIIKDMFLNKETKSPLVSAAILNKIMRKITIVLLNIIICGFACLAQDYYPVDTSFFDRLNVWNKEVVAEQIRLGKLKADSLDCRHKLYFNWLKSDNIRFSDFINALDDILHIEYFHGQQGQYNYTAIKVIKRFAASMKRSIDNSVKYNKLALEDLDEAWLLEEGKKHVETLLKVEEVLKEIEAALELVPNDEFAEKMKDMIKIVPDLFGEVYPDIDNDAPEGSLYWYKGADGKKIYFSTENEFNNLRQETPEVDAEDIESIDIENIETQP